MTLIIFAVLGMWVWWRFISTDEDKKFLRHLWNLIIGKKDTKL